MKILRLLSGFNKIHRVKGTYYYRLKKLYLNKEEAVILDLFYLQKGVVPNPQLLELFYIPTLDEGTIIRRKNNAFLSLQSRLQGILTTDDPLFFKHKDINDKRSYYYEINDLFFDL